ncbi:MAG: SDR family NAD(P)-dependent oxidoreductase [Alphaproteobacteria bacterium]
MGKKKISSALQKKLNQKYHGKKIWLIGGSRGMGLALARLMANAGADIILSARTKPLDNSFPYQFLPLDVKHLATLTATCKKQKNLDGVIYMSGMHKQNLVCDLLEQDLFDIIAVNMQAPTLVAKIMAKDLDKRKGFFVICGSLTSFIGAPLGQPYSASKAYLKNLVETMAMEYHNLHIHLLAPGFVRTALVEQITMPMPFTMDADDASLEFAKRIMGRSLVIDFPFIITLFPVIWRMTPLRMKKILWLMIRKKTLL